MDGANLYVVDSGDVVSQKAPVSSRNPKSDPLRKLSAVRRRRRASESDDTTRRQADPIADAQTVTSADPMTPDRRGGRRRRADEDLRVRRHQPDADAAGAAVAVKNVPPAPPRPSRFDSFMPPPPLPSESPFDEFPPTPGPDPTFAAEDDAEFSETPPPARPHAPFNPPPPPQPFGGIPPAPALNFGGGPPPDVPRCPGPAAISIPVTARAAPAAGAARAGRVRPRQQLRRRLPRDRRLRAQLVAGRRAPLGAAGIVVLVTLLLARPAVPGWRRR